MNALAHASMPHSLEIEQALLGALLINNEALHGVTFLRPDHFHEPLHGVIYDHIATIAQTGRATPATVLGYLPKDLRIGDFNPGQYLARLTAEAITVSGAPSYARAIFDHATRRHLVQIGEDIANAARSIGIDHPPAQQIADAEARLFDLATIQREREKQSEESLDDIVTGIEEAAASGKGVAGIACGLKAIDEKLGGFEPGSLIIVAGRPGMGKTALGLSLARRAARIGVGVAFDSIEMPRKQITRRLLSDETEAMRSPVPYTNMARGKISPTELDHVRRAAERVRDLPLIINDQGNRLADIPGHIRGARRELDKRGVALGLYIVDYLGLLRPSDRYAGNKVHETGEISAGLKEIAKREKLPIIGLHQLNRALERQDEKRPGLADLRDSGNIEQDADVVAFVFREHYYLSRAGARVPNAEKGDDRSDEARLLALLHATEHQMEFIIAKNRHGPVGIARLWCDMATNSVRDEA